jgi:DNA-binding MarR family transcriptional regulator
VPTLDRLETKGLVASKTGQARRSAPRARRYYSVTGAGVRALNAAKKRDRQHLARTDMAAEKPRVNRTEAEPPAWASWLLPWVVRADRAEGIEGDMLEEYGERVGRHGRRMADAWYVRQVVGFLWRLSWPFGLLVTALVITRSIADTFVPPDNYQVRSVLLTFGAIWGYLFAGAYAAWRTRRDWSGGLVSGAIVALSAHAIGSAISIAAGIALYFTVISRDPAMARLFQMTAAGANSGNSHFDAHRHCHRRHRRHRRRLARQAGQRTHTTH